MSHRLAFFVRSTVLGSVVTLWLTCLSGCSLDNSVGEQGSGGQGAGGVTATGGTVGKGGSEASGGSVASGGTTAASGGRTTGSGGNSVGTGGRTTGTGGATTDTGGTTADSGGTSGTGTGGRNPDAGRGGAADASTSGRGGTAGATSGAGTGGSTAPGGSTGTKSAGCGKSITRQDAKTQKTMSVGGTTRYYLLYTPTSYDPDTALPMVFILHGMDMNNWWAANDSSGFKMIEASSNKAILVYPQGSGDAPGTTSKWGGIKSNWGDSENGADMKFIDALVESMQDSYCVDTSRIFVTGFSMGGMMTESLACARSEVFRAFAPVAGWGPGGFGGMNNPTCSDASVTVPVMITQGSSDGTVSPSMGQASRDFWIKRNTCTTTTTKMTVPSGQASCVAYQGCKEGTAVDYCTHTGGHMVPSNTGGYVWDFFSSFN